MARTWQRGLPSLGCQTVPAPLCWAVNGQGWPDMCSPDIQPGTLPSLSRAGNPAPYVTLPQGMALGEGYVTHTAWNPKAEGRVLPLCCVGFTVCRNGQASSTGAKRALLSLAPMAQQEQESDVQPPVGQHMGLDAHGVDLDSPHHAGSAFCRSTEQYLSSSSCRHCYNPSPLEHVPHLCFAPHVSFHGWGFIPQVVLCGSHGITVRFFVSFFVVS